MPILLNNAIDKVVKTFDLRSPEAIAKERGTVTGSPTIDRDGIDLSGTAEFVTYTVSNVVFSHPEISIITEFTPDFDYDENDQFCLYDTSDGLGNNSFYVKKMMNASDNALQIRLNGTVIANITDATYGAYWKANKRNVLVISSDSINDLTNVWLNGTQILTNNATAWAASADVILFYAGVVNDGGTPFRGKIHSVLIKKDLTTAAEAMDMWDNSSFNFQNAADCWIDCKSQVGKRNGTELIVDGDMEAVGVAAWAVGVDVTASKETTNPHSGSQVIRLTQIQAPTGAGWIRQVILTAGKRYRITGWGRGDGVLSPRLGDLPISWIGTVSTEWQYFDLTFTATAAPIYFYAAGNSIGNYIEFDDVSVQEVYQYTEDKSGQGNDFMLGDGTTAAKMPAFTNPGFDFDGTNDYLSVVSTGMFNNTYQTIAICFKPDFAVVENTRRYLFHTTAGSAYAVARLETASYSNALYLYMGDTLVDTVAASVYIKYWKQYGANILIVSGTTGATKIWLNGFEISTSAQAWSPADPAALGVGSYAGGTEGWFDGKIMHFSTYGNKFNQHMTPTQVRQLTQFLKNQYS